jgi:hypothetical protein
MPLTALFHFPKNHGFFGLGRLHLTPARCGEQSLPSPFCALSCGFCAPVAAAGDLPF